MSRCLVTGHRGFIGSRLYKKLKEEGHDVLGVDFKDTPMNCITTVLKEDFNMFHPKYFNFKPEYIFHTAYTTRVPISIEDPVGTSFNNIYATSILLNFARKVGAKRVIFSSSSSVVGDGTEPLSPYALQKLFCEKECRLYSKLYGLDTVSLRYFNVYSEDQIKKRKISTLLCEWMFRLKRGRTLYISGDGEQRRDMTHVSDVVDANIFIMNQHQDFNGEVFDVGTGSNISINEIKEVVKKHNPNAVIKYSNPREGDVLFTKADVSKMRKLGWKASVNIFDGINACFKKD